MINANSFEITTDFIIDAINEIESEFDNNEFYVFKSQDGKELEDEYQDLLNYVNVSGLFEGMIASIQPFQNLTKDSGNFRQLLSEFIDLGIKGAKNNKNFEKKAALKAKEEILVFIDHLINIGSKKLEEFEKLTDDLNEALGEKKEEKEIEEVEDSDFSVYLTEIKHLGRVIAYFTTSLYAIIDNYIKGLIVLTMTIIPKEQIYKATKSIKREISNPKSSIERCIHQIKSRDPKLKEKLNVSLQDMKWDKKRAIFSKFTNLRQKPAHQPSYIEVDEIKNHYPEITKKVQIEIKKLRKELKKQEFPKIIQEAFENFIPKFENILYLQEIGNSCIQYLALIDNIFHQYEVHQ